MTIKNKEKQVVCGKGFKPKQIFYDVNSPTKGIRYLNLGKESAVRFDKDGVVLNFKPCSQIGYITNDDVVVEKTRIRKLPNKQQWKVYYNK